MAKTPKTLELPQDPGDVERLAGYVNQLKRSGEARAYTPNLRDRAANALRRTGLPEGAVEGLVGSRGIGSTGLSLGDFVPGVGNAFAASDAATAAGRGAYGEAALAGFGAIPFLPFGKAAKATKAAEPAPKYFKTLGNVPAYVKGENGKGVLAASDPDLFASWHVAINGGDKAKAKAALTALSQDTGSAFWDKAAQALKSLEAGKTKPVALEMEVGKFLEPGTEEYNKFISKGTYSSASENGLKKHSYLDVPDEDLVKPVKYDTKAAPAGESWEPETVLTPEKPKGMVYPSSTPPPPPVLAQPQKKLGQVIPPPPVVAPPVAEPKLFDKLVAQAKAGEEMTLGDLGELSDAELARLEKYVFPEDVDNGMMAALGDAGKDDLVDITPEVAGVVDEIPMKQPSVDDGWGEPPGAQPPVTLGAMAAVKDSGGLADLFGAPKAAAPAAVESAFVPLEKGFVGGAKFNSDDADNIESVIDLIYKGSSYDLWKAAMDLNGGDASKAALAVESALDKVGTSPSLKKALMKDATSPGFFDDVKNMPNGFGAAASSDAGAFTSLVNAFANGQKYKSSYGSTIDTLYKLVHDEGSNDLWKAAFDLNGGDPAKAKAAVEDALNKVGTSYNYKSMVLEDAKYPDFFDFVKNLPGAGFTTPPPVDVVDDAFAPFMTPKAPKKAAAKKTPAASPAPAPAPVSALGLPPNSSFFDSKGKVVPQEALASWFANPVGEPPFSSAMVGKAPVVNLDKFLKKAKDGVPPYKLYLTTADGTQHGGVKPKVADPNALIDPEEFNPAAFTTLPLDLKSRMERAKAMGFDINQVLYHGMPKYQTKRWDGLGFNASETKNETGLFTTLEPHIAAKYASGAQMGENMLKMYGRTDKPKIVDWKGKNYAEAPMISEIADAWAGGHDFLRIKNMYDMGGLQDQLIYRNPNQLRSIFAVFDPKYKDSKNLLRAGIPAALASPFVLAEAVRKAEEREEQ
jgi:hypothetical protein